MHYASWHVGVWGRRPWTVPTGLGVLRSSAWVLWPWGSAVHPLGTDRLGHGGVRYGGALFQSASKP
jgi:hypothetical protein